MVIGVPSESSPHEKRVALVPGVVPLLIKAGVKVLVERGAGETAGFPDAAYEGVLMAAGLLGKMFPMMITAAGTITPSRVFVIGAGVAGLQAIATAHRLGAVIQAYDVRPAVKEQVESLGAKFVELELESKGAEAASGYAADMGEDFYRRQRELLTRVVAESDVVITTAAIPGKKAPVLITSEAVEGMRRGGVIIDLAAETGGNCQLTQPGRTVDVRGVTVIGPLNLSSTVPYH